MKLLSFFVAGNPYGLDAKSVGLPTGAATPADVLQLAVKTGFFILGALSVIFVIVGGLQIVLSSGDPKRVKQGRETIIYAIVGIVISVAAFAIVSFIGQIGK